VAALEEASGTDHQRLVELGQRVEEAQAAVQDAEERWLALAEHVEETNPGLLG
jgi:hypothetical protein